MNKVIVPLVLLLQLGVAAAQSGGSAAQMPAAPAAGEPAPPPAADKPTAAQLHQTCVDAMNADPTFAKSIVTTADKQASEQIDQRTIAAHQDADFHIQKNERHVIYAYAAMWVIAALFVLFLWMRQVKLLGDIATLKRDLEAATKDAK